MNMPIISKWFSRLLIILGIILTFGIIGIHEYFMIIQGLHIEFLLVVGPMWGFPLILIGVIYALTPRTLLKILMGSFIALSNMGFLAALWIYFTTPKTGTLHQEYLLFIEWSILPVWLIINLLGAYYLIKVKKQKTEQFGDR